MATLRAISDDMVREIEVVGPLDRRWACYDFGRLVHGASLSFEVAANWKLAVENFIDIYHVPYVHPALNRYLPMDEHYFVKEGEYVVELTMDVEGVPETIPFMMISGEPTATASILVAIAVGLAVFVITIRAIKIKQARKRKPVSEAMVPVSR